MMVDFNIIEAENSTIFCVLPGQVHQGFLMDNVNGWFVAVKSDMVPDAVRSVFEEFLEGIHPLKVETAWVEKSITQLLCFIPFIRKRCWLPKKVSQ
jgi:hypothetical protein